jgi:crotonobetainyl-CoA:carnitine CoA-transferase CaiB-like acyl-CoA transferase
MLGCADTEEAVSRTLLMRDALDWESLLAEAGICAAMCRSPKEWDSSEQGRELASHPVVEVIKISDSDPEPMRGGHAPLTDVRVLDLTRVLAGPTCARTLAHFGADTMVISAPDLPSIPAFVTDTGHGKRAAFCDLKTSDGRATLQRLVRSADVFSQGYRQGALARHGFSALDLARMRPGLINVEINCYGHEGPWRGWRGWEQLAQTVTGMAHQHGGARSPVLQPAAVCDYTTGFLAAFGALIALRRRALYGGSYLVRASLCQTAMWVRSLGYDNETRLHGEGFKPEEIERWRISADTGFGQMHFLRPALRMSQTAPTWTRGVVPLGTHAAAWTEEA